MQTLRKSRKHLLRIWQKAPKLSPLGSVKKSIPYRKWILQTLRKQEKRLLRTWQKAPKLPPLGSLKKSTPYREWILQMWKKQRKRPLQTWKKPRKHLLQTLRTWQTLNIKLPLKLWQKAKVMKIILTMFLIN